MNQYWVWISRLKRINLKKFKAILEEAKTIENIWSMNKNSLIKIKELDKNDVEGILNLQYRQDLEKYINYMKKNNIKMINIYDELYPEKLKNIYDPPLVIYVKGNGNILNEFSIGIVGCRMCTKYGEEVSKKFAYDLQKYNVNVISGLARGIDSYAHIGTLKGKGKTIAVVGTGLDIVYPNENTFLSEEIIKNNGAIISEYIVGTKPEKTNFPARNRIISGLSNGILVVEARERSGTFITVDFALEQGKNVFVIPGNILSSSSKGTNELIKQGAKLVTKVEDVLEEYL